MSKNKKYRLRNHTLKLIELIASEIEHAKNSYGLKNQNKSKGKRQKIKEKFLSIDFIQTKTCKYPLEIIDEDEEYVTLRMLNKESRRFKLTELIATSRLTKNFSSEEYERFQALPPGQCLFSGEGHSNKTFATKDNRNEFMSYTLRNIHSTKKLEERKNIHSDDDEPIYDVS